MLTQLTDRLSDKVSEVRVFAAKALAPLQDASDPSDPILLSLLQTLANDPVEYVDFFAVLTNKF